ncbi:MAG: SDR family NAD(P)-dependent oxidoreductase [Acidobacteria bacterium]|nr:SDR family NAD(P)-dependent oxidoreductase [Acidobacteriota bacterium]
MKVVLLGATKGIGRAVARVLASRGAQIALLGRDLAEVERSARDLEARGAQGRVAAVPCDLSEPEGFGAALDAAAGALDGFDTVIVTAAAFATQDQLERDTARLQTLLTTNFTNTILFCEEARTRLLARGGGTLCVVSSVAGERGRTPVVLYGATKAGLSAYLEGLDHRFHRQGLITVCVKPGFVTTTMTEGLPRPPFAGSPEGVAARIVRAIDRGTPVVYAPGIWALVMWVIRLLPRAVMRRVKF